MENRYRIHNNTHLIEMPLSVIGKQFLQSVRKNYPEFKGKRIKTIIQAYPSKVEIGIKHKIT